MTALATALEHHLTILSTRLHLAAQPGGPQARQAGELRGRTDDFIMAAAQHVGAVVEVVLPVLPRQSAEDRRSARAFVCSAKRFERALVIAKAKQYGQAQNVPRAWREVWSLVETDFAAVAAAEREMVRRLTTALPATEVALLGARLSGVANRTPTRAHPYLPHTGLAGRLTRRVWSRIDRVWDEFEGRITHPFDHPSTHLPRQDRAPTGSGRLPRPGLE